MHGDRTPPRPPSDARDATGANFDAAWRDDRRYLVGMATRMLGNGADAEDVVQEAFGRLVGAELDEIRDARAWLTVAVRRLCLNRLQSAYTRRESVAGAALPELGVALQAGAVDPGDRVTLDDQVQIALAVVLERLTPPERTAFVLHDVFGLPFTEIGEIVGRTSTACRQLASRARRAVRDDGEGPRRDLGTSTAGRSGDVDEADRHSVVAERFIAACGDGDIAGLVAVLAPDVVGLATFIGGRHLDRVEGAHAVAARAVALLGPAGGTTLVPVPLDGHAGAVAVTRGRVRAVLRLEVEDGLVHHIESFVLPPRPAGRADAWSAGDRAAPPGGQRPAPGRDLEGGDGEQAGRVEGGQR